MFKTVNYIKTSDSGPFSTHTWKYSIRLPKPLCDWDVFDYWEKERVKSMEENLAADDLLFDIGSESGWMSVVFANFCKVFLIEPTKEFWPNIYQTWIQNVSEPPVGCWSGLVGQKSTGKYEKSTDPWPKESLGTLLDKNKYQYINDHEQDIKTITVDDLVKQSGVIPTALTIDVEGAEMLVLKGAHKTLKENKPKVWISIHPDLMEKYKSTPEEVIKFMTDLGYKETHLATDHEEHYSFL